MDFWNFQRGSERSGGAVMRLLRTGGAEMGGIQKEREQ